MQVLVAAVGLDVEAEPGIAAEFERELIGIVGGPIAYIPNESAADDIGISVGIAPTLVDERDANIGIAPTPVPSTRTQEALARDAAWIERAINAPLEEIPPPFACLCLKAMPSALGRCRNCDGTVPRRAG